MSIVIYQSPEGIYTLVTIQLQNNYNNDLYKIPMKQYTVIHVSPTTTTVLSLFVPACTAERTKEWHLIGWTGGVSRGNLCFAGCGGIMRDVSEK